MHKYAEQNAAAMYQAAVAGNATDAKRYLNRQLAYEAMSRYEMTDDGSRTCSGASDHEKCVRIHYLEKCSRASYAVILLAMAKDDESMQAWKLLSARDCAAAE